MAQNVSKLLLGIFGIAMLLLLLASLEKCQRPAMTPYQGASRTDTVYINRVQTDTVLKVITQTRTIPHQVTVYLPDTARRQRLERDTLVTGLKLTTGRLEVHTISPEGISMLSQYKAPPLQFTTLTMDAEGQVSMQVDSAAIRKAERRAKWRKAGNWALFGLAVGIGYWAGSR